MTETTFDDLKEGALEFWGEKNPQEYVFYDSKMNQILMDREDLTVDKFFETFLLTKSILILMKPVLNQRNLLKEQKDSTLIKYEKNVKHEISNFGNIYVFRDSTTIGGRRDRR